MHQTRGLQVLEQKVPISCNFKADFGDEIPIFPYFTFYASLLCNYVEIECLVKEGDGQKQVKKVW